MQALAKLGVDAQTGIDILIDEDVIEDSDVRQAAVPCAILEDRSGWSADTVHNHMRRVLRSHPPAFGNGQGIAGCERSHDGGKGRLAAAVLSVDGRRSEEHTSELQSLMRISYAVFCL